jgi:exonuclease III
VRIATFNINNVVGRLDNLLAWLDRDQPDVVCLQELKADQAAFPLKAMQAAGYEAVWRGQHRERSTPSAPGARSSKSRAHTGMTKRKPCRIAAVLNEPWRQ